MQEINKKDTETLSQLVKLHLKLQVYGARKHLNTHTHSQIHTHIYTYMFIENKPL